MTISVPCVKDLQVLHVEMLGNKSETKNHNREPIYMQFLDEIYIMILWWRSSIFILSSEFYYIHS